MLLIFAMLQSKGTKPKYTKGNCQERVHVCKTPFWYLFQSHSVACFESGGLEETHRSATLCETLPPCQLPKTTAQFAGLAKALDRKRSTKFPATDEGVRPRKAYLCKSVSSIAACHRWWSPCKVSSSIRKDTVCYPSAHRTCTGAGAGIWNLYPRAKGQGRNNIFDLQLRAWKQIQSWRYKNVYGFLQGEVFIDCLCGRADVHYYGCWGIPDSSWIPCLTPVTASCESPCFAKPWSFWLQL